MTDTYDNTNNHKKYASQEADVIIIGAGVSGLYSGWRLLTGQYKSPLSIRNE